MSKWDGIHTRTMGYDDILRDLGRVIQLEALAERDAHYDAIEALQAENAALRDEVARLQDGREKYRTLLKGVYVIARTGIQADWDVIERRIDDLDKEQTQQPLPTSPDAQATTEGEG